MTRAAGQPKKQKLMWEALREATDEEMEKDPTVCVMGEQIVSAPKYPVAERTGRIATESAACRRGCGTLWRLLQSHV